MTLRTKTLIIVGATLIGLLTLVFIASRIILLGSYQQLEEDLAQQNLERALNAISAELDAFERQVEHVGQRLDERHCPAG